MTPLCDRDVADEDAIMSVEEGGAEVEESGPSESRDESEIDIYAYCYLTDIHWRRA